jgi:hypothetical protein
MPQPTWRVRSAQVMSEVLDGEAVIIDLMSGRYHGASGVGATVWQAISAGCSMEDLLADVARLHTAVPEDAADQIRRFIDQLVTAGLVVEENGRQASQSIAGIPTPITTPWSMPELESHDDLQDLLLLDPVHEVTEAGWPHAAPSGS